MPATARIELKVTPDQYAAIEAAIEQANKHGANVNMSIFVRDSLAHMCKFYGVDFPREEIKRGGAPRNARVWERISASHQKITVAGVDYEAILYKKGSRALYTLNDCREGGATTWAIYRRIIEGKSGLYLEDKPILMGRDLRRVKEDFDNWLIENVLRNIEIP